MMAYRGGEAGSNQHQPIYLTWEEQQAHPEFPVRALKNWFQAYWYTQWLVALTGQLWRLPTEAEWERAAKGTDNRRYPGGNERDPEEGPITIKPEENLGVRPNWHTSSRSESLLGRRSRWQCFRMDEFTLPLVPVRP